MSQSIVVYPDGALPDLSGTEEEVLRRMGSASWWLVPGRDRTRKRVITTLLHGNEPSGFRAIRAWSAAGSVPAVDLLFFVSAVEAAIGPPLYAHRIRPGGHDQNRVFFPPFMNPEGERADALLKLIDQSAPEALIDLHNNTGHNPAYGVGTRVDEQTLGLTSLFADRFMHSDIRLGTLMEALDGQIPCAVIECGRAGDPVADATALAGLDRFATLEDLSRAAAHAHGVEVLVHPRRIEVKSVSLAFGDRPDPNASFTVRRGIDQHNFKTMAAGEILGWTRDNDWPIAALGRSQEDVSRILFELREGEIRLLRPMVPVMMTASAEIARADCLFYAMERRD